MYAATKAIFCFLYPHARHSVACFALSSITERPIRQQRHCSSLSTFLSLTFFVRTPLSLCRTGAAPFGWISRSLLKLAQATAPSKVTARSRKTLRQLITLIRKRWCGRPCAVMWINAMGERRGERETKTRVSIFAQRARLNYCDGIMSGASSSWRAKRGFFRGKS